MPLAILAGGWFGYVRLSVETVKEQPEAEEKRTLRTRVASVEPTSYPIAVETNAVVQSHNQVVLAAEVAGAVTRVSPKFEVGAYFSEGDILVEIDPRNYASARAIAKSRLQAAKSALDLAKLDEKRKLRLIERNAVSGAEVDVASATREQAEADVELAQAELERTELDLKRTKVAAPFDGRVRTKNIGLGQMANANTPLGEIFAIDFAEVRLPISAQQRRFLELPEVEGDPAVRVVLRDAISRSVETTWPARIVRTEGVLDADSRDMFAIARVDDPFGLESGLPPLRIGQPVVASIDGVVLRDVVALPRAAVRQLDKIVLVKQDGQTLLPMTIEPVWSDAQHVVVTASAIPDGTWLATTPMIYTPEGTVVEVIEDQASPMAVAESCSPAKEERSTN
ncbi:efflux RND transporter periplasmic adaptor subunit [Posidoniimonas polymericola]|uniref:efflux RND transporter periplasmic adaptor subunit n=1 Tax=Posidoniimonas polymericola TaxID=2528002 RepID=UPI0018D3947C|nr:efflux RND transporter periplasmic adaptor subunit [Posidoniimonas polymericola]